MRTWFRFVNITEISDFRKDFCGRTFLKWVLKEYIVATWIGWDPHLPVNTKEYAGILAVKTSRLCLLFSQNALRCENSDPCLVKRASVSKWTFVTSASTVLIVARWPSVLPRTWRSSWCRPYIGTAGSRLRGVQVSSVLPKKAGLLVWTAGRSAETETQCGLLHVSAVT